MTILELFDELLKYPKEEINYALFYLLLKEKIDFVQLSEMYVKSLEKINEDKENKLIEAETIIMESFHDKPVKSEEKDKSRGKSNYKHTQRSLYFLNMNKRFNMKSMNEEYSYDEEKAKELSWYERNKKRY